MTAPGITPYWGDDADWAGLLLLIVPATPLPAPVGELARLVRDRIESDAALYDVVTVAHAPPPVAFQATADWQRAVLVSLIRAAMPDGHFLAPRGILATVVVGESEVDVRWALDQLHEDGPLSRLRRISYACTLRPDPDRGGIAPMTVRSIARTASKGIAAYEQSPDLAMDERVFLAEVGGLAEQGLITPEELAVAPPAPQAVAPPAPQAVAPPAPQAVAPPAPQALAPPAPQALAPPAPQALAPPTPRPAPRVRATAPVPTRPAPPAPAPPPLQTPGLPMALPRRQPQAPVFHHGDDMVLVDSRSALGRLRSPAPTDADAVGRLARSTDAVSLVYFVVVPDEQSSARKVSREHRTLALSLDQLLATVVGDALTGRRMRVAVEVLAALNPLRKHGVLRPAGDLTEGDLPKVPAELFDHAKTVEALLNAAQRTVVAFRARSVEVLSLHYIFLSSVAIHDANTAGADWDRLLEHARVTWIDIGPTRLTDRREPLDIAPSPYGFHLVSDRYDVAAMVREESAALYRYRPPAPEATAPEASPADTRVPGDKTGPGDKTTGTPSGRRRGWLGSWRRSADD
jgi:hypothetical protein